MTDDAPPKKREKKLREKRQTEYSEKPGFGEVKEQSPLKEAVRRSSSEV